MIISHQRIVFAALASIFLAGCGGGGGGGEGPLLSMGEGYPSRVGEVTSSGITLGGWFRINETADPRSLDPIRTGETSAHNVSRNIYDAFFEFDQELNLIPALAESYEISEDGKTYTFAIRRGVKFHDDPCFPNGVGREMTARDIEYSLTRVVDPSLPSTGSWIFNEKVEGVTEFREGAADSVSGFEVKDDYTFAIRLTQPFAPFLYRLAMSYCFIVPREAVEHYGEDFFQNPVGTGAYDFVHWKPDQEILLKRNPDYWGTDEDGIQLPYLDGIRFSLIKDFKIEFLQFETGELDHVQRIHEDIWPKVFDENANVRPEYQKYPVQSKIMLISQYYGFNLTKEPYKDNKPLRQALNYAIDRKSICKFVMKGRGIPAVGIIPPSMPEYNQFIDDPAALAFEKLFDPENYLAPESIRMPYSYDPGKARELLAEAGYPNGEGLGELELQLNSGGTLNESLAEAIQAQLREVGVQVRLQIVEWTQHLENIDQNRASFFRLGWVADYPDPENFLALFWSRNEAPVGPNYARFNHPEFDRLFEEAIALPDRERQLELYRQAEEIVLEEAPILFISHDRLTKLTQPYVNNLGINAQDTPLLKRVWLSHGGDGGA